MLHVDYDEFSDLTALQPIGSEPLYKLDADIFQIFSRSGISGTPRYLTSDTMCSRLTESRFDDHYRLIVFCCLVAGIVLYNRLIRSRNRVARPGATSTCSCSDVTT